MGFPTDFFPVLFAIPRVVGWLAHWREAMQEEAPKIWRPRQIYTGAATRSYVNIESRPEKKADLGMESHPFNRRYLVSLQSKY
jgi:citrate synthase